MGKDGRIWLSHTGLETLERCPRCFWLRYIRNIYQPEGIVSRLANRFDKVMKNYFDLFRPTGKLPPIVKKSVVGRLQNPFQEKYFVPLDRKYGFYGKLDECFVTRTSELVPVDFKTASSDPRARTDILPAYKSQIDDYIYILMKNNKKTAGYGYLIFVYPEDGKYLHKGFPMYIDVKKVKGNPANTAKRIKEAIEVLEKKIPPPSLECPFCKWYDTVRGELGEGKPKP